MKIPQMFDLSNQIAVVTGGAGFLGQSISTALAEAGALVYICSRDTKHCEQIAAKLRKQTKSKIKAKFLDIQSSKSVTECFNEISKEHGKIDILVNNAAFSKLGTLEKMSEDDWILGIDTSINGVFRTTKAVIPIMKKYNYGSIINISSMYGLVSPDPRIYGDSKLNNPPNYGAGKSAIIQFTRYAAVYLAKKGIRVNTISPGPFPNPQVQKNKQFINNLENKIPLGRIGKPDEIKGSIVFLASHASSYITGTNVIVDGGWTAW